MQDFDGKVAVVTGAASGMGRAFAETFAEQGMKVVLADVEQDALDKAVTQLRQREFDVLGVVTDVSSAAALENLKTKTLDEYGKVHVLCNNAGVGTDRELAGIGFGELTPMWEHPLKDWEWTFAVNWWGVVHGIRAFLPVMVEQGEEGHVVNTASMAGLLTGSALPIYTATKHAVVAVTESLYFQLKQINAPIGVSVLCPGGVNTRIALASRNRPAEMWAEGEKPPSREELEAREAQWAQITGPEGMAPEKVAEIVLQGIKDNRLHLLTHPEYAGAVSRRVQEIVEGKNPELRVLG
jgi:NAD(P)-dependent dehydrogenase (short-subunit alcohol dehydrogenase family)